MYVLRVPPWHSSKWEPPAGEEVGETDRAHLKRGARDFEKQRLEERAGVSGTAEEAEMAGPSSATMTA